MQAGASRSSKFALSVVEHRERSNPCIHDRAIVVKRTRMTARSLIFLCILCCILSTFAAAKKVKVEGKEYSVSAYPEDCTKYVLCRKGGCNLMSCQYTYVFDPVTATCTHRTRGAINCDRRLPRKSNFP